MIHAEELNKLGIDYQEGLKRFLNDSELYEAVLTAFIGEDMLERAQVAYDANDRESLLNVVHEAKGSGGNAGLDAIYTTASALVTLLRSHAYTDAALSAAYEDFRTAYQRTKIGVEAALR